MNGSRAHQAQCVQLPTEYFTTVLGKWRKYSACYYLGDDDNIDTAEENMLRAPFSLFLNFLTVGAGYLPQAHISYT